MLHSVAGSIHSFLRAKVLITARVFMHSGYDRGFQGQCLHMTDYLHASHVLRMLISVYQLCAIVAAFEAFEAVAFFRGGEFFPSVWSLLT